MSVSALFRKSRSSASTTVVCDHDRVFTRWLNVLRSARWSDETHAARTHALLD